MEGKKKGADSLAESKKRIGTHQLLNRNVLVFYYEAARTFYLVNRFDREYFHISFEFCACFYFFFFGIIFVNCKNFKSVYSIFWVILYDIDTIGLVIEYTKSVFKAAMAFTDKKNQLSILLISVLTCCTYVSSQKRPPNYSQDDMPITSFSCRDKYVGGYYADTETDCQMFHVCVHVPGIGIQNFRFLCPNDTSFDQEHQICDDWYNIDCELSSLYYSENFDLYRIGVNNEVKKPPTSHKGTPIPLGPSSTIKPLQGDKPKKNQYEDEDDYKRSGNDILRGSHSSNFYASSNRGRDDLDENDYEATNVGTKRQELNQNSDVKKQKTLVRKLASKRPVTQKVPQQTYQQYTETSKSVYSTSAKPLVNQNYNQAAFANKIPKSRGNVNYNTYVNKVPKQEYQKIATTAAPTIYQRINNLTELDVDNSQETVTANYDVSKTYENSYNFRQQTNAFNKQKIAAPKATYSSSTPGQTQTESIRLPSTDYLRSIAQTYQQPAAYINNQLQDTSRTNYQQYDQYLNDQNPSTKSSAFNYNEYQQYLSTYQQPSAANYQTSSTIPQSSAFQNYYQTSPSNQKSHSTDLYSYQSYTTPVAYSQPNTTFDYYKFYQTSTVSQSPRSYYTSPAFNVYQSTTAGPVKYNPYATFQKVNEKYDDEEFLKTAPSSNFKPSDLNAIHNQKKQLYINATLKAAYSVDQPRKSSFNYYQSPATSSSPKVNPSAAKATPSTSYVISSSPKPVYQKASVPVAKNTPAFASVLTNSTKNQDYDYAYYDNGGNSAEYENIDAVEEDFARIQKAHAKAQKA